MRSRDKALISGFNVMADFMIQDVFFLSQTLTYGSCKKLFLISHFKLLEIQITSPAIRDTVEIFQL